MYNLHFCNFIVHVQILKFVFIIACSYVHDDNRVDLTELRDVWLHLSEEHQQNALCSSTGSQPGMNINTLYM